MIGAEGAWPSMDMVAVNAAVKAKNQETLYALMVHPYSAGDSGTGNLGPVSFLSLYNRYKGGN